MNRFAHALFCDDIRVEVSNKQSLIGVYRGTMYVPSFPALLPKLCIAVWAVTPTDRPFKSLKLRLLAGEDQLVEQVIPPEALENIRADEPPAANPSRPRAYTAQLNLQIAPVPIEKPMVLRLRMITEDEELKAGALDIELAGPSQAVAPSP